MNPNVIYYPKEGVAKAVQKFETPFFLYEEKRLRENCRNLRGAFTKYFPNFQPLYAVKANSNPEVLKIIISEGFEFDASSDTEVILGQNLKVGGMFTGNYNPASELKVAQDAGFILNLDDVSMLDFFVGDGALSVPETISFRINPGVGKATIASNVFAGPNAKYGVPFEKAPEAYKKAKELGVKHFGIHMMTGSNVPMEDKDYFAGIIRKLFDIVADIKNKTGIEIEFMNMGGGFGVPYKPEEKSLDMEVVAKSIRGAFDEKCKEYGLKEPKLMAEPGRFIAADAGWLVSKVIVIKDSYKKFVGIDASSNDMPRPSIYGAYHHATVMKESDEKELVSIVGRICENNDQLAQDRLLPKCEIGDVVLIHNCGGHAFAMGHNYNGRPRHAEYLLQENGELRMIRRAETFEDLYKTTEV
jgi:diaminopimelate decarboxylase